MPRGIAWDDLPNHYIQEQVEQKKKNQANNPQPQVQKEKREVNLKEDVLGIGRRVAFGVIVCLFLIVAFSN